MKIKRAKNKETKSSPTFSCYDCHKELSFPIEKTAVYIIRNGKPLLVCPSCLRENDAFIWGDESVIDTSDDFKEKSKEE